MRKLRSIVRRFVNVFPHPVAFRGLASAERESARRPVVLATRKRSYVYSRIIRRGKIVPTSLRSLENVERTIVTRLISQQTPRGNRIPSSSDSDARLKNLAGRSLRRVFESLSVTRDSKFLTGERSALRLLAHAASRLPVTSMI